MRFATFTSVLLAAVPALVSAQTPAGTAGAATATVMVGMNGTLTFTPPSMNVAQGGTVQFVFMSKNHSVVQSSFADPCNPVDKGFKAQYFPIAADIQSFPTITLQVNQTAPIWFYCPQFQPANHCKAGMVGAINPTPEKTFEAFKAAAMGAAAAPGGSSTASGGASATGSGAVAPPVPSGTNGNGTAAAPPNSAMALKGGASALIVALSVVVGSLVSL